MNDGYEKGREDARDRDSYDPLRHKWYREGDHDYKSQYGPRQQYENVYRQGFKEGYDSGYREWTVSTVALAVRCGGCDSEEPSRERRRTSGQSAETSSSSRGTSPGRRQRRRSWSRPESRVSSARRFIAARPISSTAVRIGGAQRAEDIRVELEHGGIASRND